MSLKKIGTVFTSKFVGTGPASYKKRIYRSAASQRLRNTDIEFFTRYHEDFISDYLVSYLSVFVTLHFISRLLLHCFAVNPLQYLNF